MKVRVWNGESKASIDELGENVVVMEGEEWVRKDERENVWKSLFKGEERERKTEEDAGNRKMEDAKFK